MNESTDQDVRCNLMFEMMEPVRQMTLLEPCWRELLFLRTTCADEDNIVSELDLCSRDGRVLSSLP